MTTYEEITQRKERGKIVNHFSEILGQKRLKISTVSRETGITRPTLTSLYYGESKVVTFKILSKLCAYLHVTPGDLFTYEEG